MSWKEMMISKPLFHNIFISRRPRVASSAYIIHFIKTTFKEKRIKKKLKERKKLKELKVAGLNGAGMPLGLRAPARTKLKTHIWYFKVILN